MAKKGMKRPEVRDNSVTENKQAKEKRSETASIPAAQSNTANSRAKINPGK